MYPKSVRDQRESQCYRPGVYSFPLSWQRSTRQLCRLGWKVKASLCVQRTRRRTWCQRSCSALANHEAGSHHPDGSCRFRVRLSGNPHRSRSLVCRAFPLWGSHWGKINMSCPWAVLCFSLFVLFSQVQHDVTFRPRADTTWSFRQSDGLI